MKMEEDLDYEKLGLKVGLEFHQRLDTDKLFCSCNSEIKEEKPEAKIERRIRPSTGELGETDQAAIKEAIKGKKFTYDTYKDSTCLIETDSEPPHPIDTEAFELTLKIAKMLNCQLFDEIHVMRKTVVDGSNTTGFQRTAMIGHDGQITKPVETDIEAVFLEEESAGIIGETKGKKEYRLDRLGIPLVEIVTGIIQGTPHEIKETALRIGTMLRTTGKVKRGLGTIRQDLNLSIEKGNRTEIKGLQEIHLLEEMIENEVKRQLKLLEIKKELESRGVKEVNPNIEEFTEHFKKEAPEFMKKAINKGGGVYGYILPKFKGILGKELLNEHRFGTELAQIAKSLGVNGIIHTDEKLSKYSIKNNIKEIKKSKNLPEDSSILIISHKNPNKAKEVLKEIKKRLNQATKGVPQETRKALDDGTTQYLRPLGGEKRMYPETDIPAVKLSEELIQKANETPPKPEEIVTTLKNKGISEELANQSLKSPYLNTIQSLIEETNVDPTTIASTFTSTLKEIEEDIDQMKKEHFKQIFKSLEQGKFPKDALKKTIQLKSQNLNKNLNQLIKEENLTKMPKKQIKKIIENKIQEKQQLVEENPHRAFKVIMGNIMQEYSGKVNGETVSNILKKRLNQ